MQHMHFFIHSNISSSLKCVCACVCVCVCVCCSHVCASVHVRICVLDVLWQLCSTQTDEIYNTNKQSSSAVWWVMMKLYWGGGGGRTDLCDCQARDPAPLRQNTDTSSRRQRTTCYPYPSNPQEEATNLMVLYFIELFSFFSQKFTKYQVHATTFRANMCLWNKLSIGYVQYAYGCWWTWCRTTADCVM